MKYTITTHLGGQVYTETIDVSFIDVKDSSYVIYQSTLKKGHYDTDFYGGHIAKFLPVQNTIIEKVNES